MPLKALLLNPPFKPGKGFNREGRCTQESDFWSTPWPPYSLASIAAAVRGDHEVRILDCPAQGIDAAKLTTWVADHRPDVVVSSSSTQTIDSDLRVLRELKSGFGLKTAIFGIHASVFAKEIVTASEVDFVIRNEPDETARELLSAIADRGNVSQVRGLAFADPAGQAVLTEARPFVEDLDGLPYPAWDLVDLDNYRLPFYGRRFLIISTIRGCPFRCSFCNAHVYYGSRARLRSVPSIVEEIEHCRRSYGIEDIFFWGDTFTLVREQIRSLCERIIDEGLGIRWVANSRVDTVDAEILGLMRRAGCWMVSYGIESGDAAVLRRCGKGISPERVVEAVRLTKAAGIRVAGHFILGLPGETEASARRTLDLARALDLDFANFYSAVPFPGSALYDEALGQGWLRGVDWRRFHQSDFVMDIPTITAARLRKLRRKAYRSALFRPKNVTLAADVFRHRVLHPFHKASGNPKDGS